jgi:hypothetical protein
VPRQGAEIRRLMARGSGIRPATRCGRLFLRGSSRWWGVAMVGVVGLTPARLRARRAPPEGVGDAADAGWKTGLTGI